MNLSDIKVTPLKIVDTFGGNVLHAIKQSDEAYRGFGEAYFSIVEHGVVKAWKKHNRQVSNLIVPVGRVRFVIMDEFNQSKVIDLSQDNYCRLTIPPGLWFGFMGVDQGVNLVLNVSSIEHDPEEVDRKLKHDFDFDWSITQ